MLLIPLIIIGSEEYIYDVYKDSMNKIEYQYIIINLNFQTNDFVKCRKIMQYLKNA